MDKRKDLEKLFAQYGYDELINQILALFSQWISVEDRLPEKNQIVLWWNKGGNMVEMGSWNYRRGEIITHWQPLPQPPRESDNG